MKPIFLILVILICPISIFSQIQKGNILLDFSGNYSKKFSNNGVINNYFQNEEKQLNSQISLAYAVGNSYYLGAGFQYGYQKLTSTNKLLIPGVYIMSSVMETKTNMPIPYIYGGYYKQIWNKLYFTVDLRVGYSFSTVKTESLSAVRSLIDDNYIETEIIGVNSSMNEEVNANLLLAGINPRVHYFLGARMSAFLELGNLQYSIQDWDSNLSQWNVDFSPKYWSVGVMFTLSNK